MKAASSSHIGRRTGEKKKKREDDEEWVKLSDSPAASLHLLL